MLPQGAWIGIRKDNEADMIYHYRSGEEVRVGDRVFTANKKRGVVVKVIDPNSQDSADFSCPEGGVMINEDWDGVPSWVLFRHQESILEHIDFIERAKDDNDTHIP